MTLVDRVIPFIVIGIISALFQTHFAGAESDAMGESLSRSVVERENFAQMNPENMHDRAAKQWEYIEWSLENTSYTGNPYDLLATVTFEHTTSNVAHKTEMFYAGGESWAFRFTGTQPGEWTFSSQSDDPDLDGISGTITVEANSAPGFVVAYGDKWGLSGTGEAFVPQYVMYKRPSLFHNKPELIDQDIEEFMVRHGFSGFHVPNVAGEWFDIESSDRRVLANMKDPDPRTFEALELLINKVYAAGGVVHIWAWGDRRRIQTPHDLNGGINGVIDQRLQRYIAARLGPLPGWTMGYGFDLWEWVRGNQLSQWHSYMQNHLGWPHLLGARASTNELNQLSETLDYSGYEQHRPKYNTYVKTISERPNKPSFSEDRFRHCTSPSIKNYDMDMTRRGLYHSAMAGGVANIWGNLCGSSSETGSLPYANPEWIKTYATFFANRFSKDLQRCNDLTNGICLRRPGNSHYIFYREDTDTIRMNLNALVGAQSAVAVDAKKAYVEIPLDDFKSGDQTWTAPYISDWVIAIGDYGIEVGPSPVETPVATPKCPCLYLPFLHQ